MYTLMIVDDEFHVVEALKLDLNVEKLGISKLYTAYNAKQAKQLLCEHRIDIMLCDIEMPQGSGLELLEWMKSSEVDTACIFLTSYADFRYAKQALQLGSLDYLLKPATVDELEQAINKAIQYIQQKEELKNSTRYQRLWEKQQPLVIERFWLDLLSHSIPSTVEQIKQYADTHHFPFSEEMSFVPVLIRVRRWYKQWSIRDEKIFEYALKKSAEEIICTFEGYSQIIELERGLFLVVLTAEEEVQAKIEQLKDNCEQYISTCNQYFYCDVACYIGKKARTHEMVDIVDRLLVLERNNVVYDNKVLFLTGSKNSPKQVAMPDMHVWSTMLKNGSKEEVLREVTQFFDMMVKEDGLDAKVLERFRQDFMQMVFFVLNLKGIQSHKLFSDATSMQLMENATRSVTEMMAWVNHMVVKSLDHSDKVEEVNSVVEKVKQYIAVNLDKVELSREDIANHVYLNPAYLSRLFKKETGQSLTEYLLEQRIELAKKLLTKTNMTVSEVASSVGYHNFSHFTKMFKKHTALNPKEYRQKRS